MLLRRAMPPALRVKVLPGAAMLRETRHGKIRSRENFRVE